ncbi:Uncharacterized protein PECH_002032 [Penicillium ucsense]|uniref:Protein YOP1 n=1 Tax=Penicillium ucsense TaxID=2839758 RepID=A0A8J8W3E0_9EURO|nr:Uncharacterized protein PECM_004331 [Penicillium ucsense]KAF7731312.1 Uncharacterized protein PECH_002032 [Penicillium ucsense]
MFGIFADLLSSVITILFPIFASYKALRSADPSQLAPWLMYWVVLSVLLLAESWTVFIIGWFPFYSWIRLIFLCYLVLPQTQGARMLYQEYVDPFLFHHEQEIEEFIGRSHEQAKALGLQYFYKTIDLIREKVMGLPPQQPAPPPPPPSGPAAYAQSLLSRFNLPTAGAASAAGTPTGASAPSYDWYSVLGAALGSVTAAGKPREVHEEQLSASGTLLQRKLQTMSGEEKASYISRQREVLDYLRSTLSREEQALGREETEHDGLAYGAPLRKNPSDTSFDVLEDEDLVNRPRVSRTSSRWTSGWLGGERDSSGSSGGPDHARSSGYERY